MFLMKFTTKAGVGYVKSDEQNARDFYIVASKQKLKEKMEMYVVEWDKIDRGVELDPLEGTSTKQAM